MMRIIIIIMHSTKMVGSRQAVINK